MGKLVLYMPDGSTREICLTKERVTIGRRADNDSVAAASVAKSLPCILDLDEPTVANFAWSEHLCRLLMGSEEAQPHQLAEFPSSHQLQPHPAAQLAVEYPHQADNTLVCVVPTVED